MHLSRRTPLKKRILRFTMDFQKQNPEVIEGKPIHGRIKVSERMPYMRSLAKMLVRDEVLSYLLVDYNNSPERTVSHINQYLLNSQGGNKAKAVHFINTLIERINSSGYRNPEALKKYATLVKGFNENEAREYSKQIMHMINSSAEEFNAVLEICRQRLQK